MSLKEQLAELIGTQVHALDISVKGKTLTLHFRELDGQEAEVLLDQARGDEESLSKAGQRAWRKLVTTASLCNADGSTSDLTTEFVASLPARIYNQLQNHALKVNGMWGESDDPKA